MKISALLLIAFFLVSCLQPETPIKIKGTALLDTAAASPVTTQPASLQAIDDYYQVLNDSVVLPPFSIQLNLSAEAEKKLKRSNETIVVSADFEGKPKDTADAFFQQWGYVVVGNSQIELTKDRTATFSNVKISKATNDSLASKDVEVLINVFSGRHSTTNNLLDCEFLQEPISKVRPQVNVLQCKLIGE